MPHKSGYGKKKPEEPKTQGEKIAIGGQPVRTFSAPEGAPELKVETTNLTPEGAAEVSRKHAIQGQYLKDLEKQSLKKEVEATLTMRNLKPVKETPSVEKMQEKQTAIAKEKEQKGLETGELARVPLPVGGEKIVPADKGEAFKQGGAEIIDVAQEARNVIGSLIPIIGKGKGSIDQTIGALKDHNRALASSIKSAAISGDTLKAEEDIESAVITLSRLESKEKFRGGDIDYWGKEGGLALEAEIRKQKRMLQRRIDELNRVRMASNINRARAEAGLEAQPIEVSQEAEGVEQQ